MVQQEVSGSPVCSSSQHRGTAHSPTPVVFPWGCPRSLTFSHKNGVPSPRKRVRNGIKGENRTDKNAYSNLSPHDQPLNHLFPTESPWPLPLIPPRKLGVLVWGFFLALILQLSTVFRTSPPPPHPSSPLPEGKGSLGKASRLRSPHAGQSSALTITAGHGLKSNSHLPGKGERQRQAQPSEPPTLLQSLDLQRD